LLIGESNFLLCSFRVDTWAEGYGPASGCGRGRGRRSGCGCGRGSGCGCDRREGIVGPLGRLIRGLVYGKPIECWSWSGCGSGRESGCWLGLGLEVVSRSGCWWLSLEVVGEPVPFLVVVWLWDAALEVEPVFEWL
jgi:hypothetical protein